MSTKISYFAPDRSCGDEPSHKHFRPGKLDVIGITYQEPVDVLQEISRFGLVARVGLVDCPLGIHTANFPGIVVEPAHTGAAPVPCNALNLCTTYDKHNGIGFDKELLQFVSHATTRHQYSIRSILVALRYNIDYGSSPEMLASVNLVAATYIPSVLKEAGIPRIGSAADITRLLGSTRESSDALNIPSNRRPRDLEAHLLRGEDRRRLPSDLLGALEE